MVVRVVLVVVVVMVVAVMMVVVLVVVVLVVVVNIVVVVVEKDVVIVAEEESSFGVSVSVVVNTVKLKLTVVGIAPIDGVICNVVWTVPVVPKGKI